MHNNVTILLGNEVMKVHVATESENNDIHNHRNHSVGSQRLVTLKIDRDQFTNSHASPNLQMGAGCTNFLKQWSEMP